MKLQDIPQLFQNKDPQILNCQEVYSLWDILSAKYQFLENLHIWRNFAHDMDLKVKLNSIDSVLAEVVKDLEKLSKKTGVNGPERGVVDINTSTNTEVIRDELIAQNVLIWLQGVTELLLRGLRTTTTNDDERTLFIKIINKNLKMLDNICGYMRIKGWINPSPIYPNIPKDTKEIIDTGEAFHLWDHLTFRYDNIHQTEIYIDVAHDKELKILLTLGLQNTLQKQTNMLEKECLHFGIPLPKRPASIIEWPASFSHIIHDDYIYRVIYIGIIGATLIHAVAVKQSVTNDRVRKIFIDLLESEINIQDDFIKYGKLKGYINEPPKYILQA
jgi:hypothetical protein